MEDMCKTDQRLKNVVVTAARKPGRIFCCESFDTEEILNSFTLTLRAEIVKLEMYDFEECAMPGGLLMDFNADAFAGALSLPNLYGSEKGALQ
jgi:hypothetical protein